MHYNQTCDAVLKSMNSSAGGLTKEEAAARALKYGKNELMKPKKKSLLAKFAAQLKDVMILILIAAAVISFVVGLVQNSRDEFIDAAIVVIIVLINSIIGIVQESRAEHALEALKKLNVSTAKVMRGGEIHSVNTEDIVPGDIVLLEAGDIVPADLRLIESASLKIQESALTGESVPSDKSITEIAGSAPIGDHKNMAYTSGVVTYGRGRGVAVATGMQSEIGKIAKMLSNGQPEPTPLQKKLNQAGKIISITVVSFAIIIFIAGLFNKSYEGNIFIHSFMTAVAVAVAAIPEGLPAAVTIVMALGVQRLSKRNAIIKKLPAVETLGCAEVICSDKTGTLTMNKMTVKKVMTVNGENIGQDLSEILRCMVLCNDSKKEAGTKKFDGDPTEVALVDFGYQKGFAKIEIDKKHPRIDEQPFDSERKLMSVAVMKEGSRITYTKGAADELLSRCESVLDGGTVRPITAHDKKVISAQNEKMAKDALRVLAFAAGEYNGKMLEEKLTFIGLCGLIDPPRAEVFEAVKKCKKAGLTAIMITGDHKETAHAIAKEIGMADNESQVITGRELDALSDAEFAVKIKHYKVYARVSPENKVRIVKQWKKLGKVTAMTGDGVNDAPAIKSADIGIGMGITGTEVTKGIADMVLADDNFATIVVAVEEGRTIYANIQKAIQFLLSANVAEVLSLFFVTLFFRELMFLAPVQILFINLVSDTFPALALGVEKPESDIMEKPPRKNTNNLFAGRMGVDILIQGIIQTIMVLAVFFVANAQWGNVVATTMTLATLCFIQLFHSFNMRSQENSLFTLPIFGNKHLWYTFFICGGLTVAIIALPFLNPIFGTVPLNAVQWLSALAWSIAIIPAIEVYKLIMKVKSKK